MAKKIKKKHVEQEPVVDNDLDDVEEDDRLEVEFDDKTNEVLLVSHYRKSWGDEFDYDNEHALDMEETAELAMTLLMFNEKQKQNVILGKVAPIGGVLVGGLGLGTESEELSPIEEAVEKALHPEEGEK